MLPAKTVDAAAGGRGSDFKNRYYTHNIFRTLDEYTQNFIFFFRILECYIGTLTRGTV